MRALRGALVLAAGASAACASILGIETDRTYVAPDGGGAGTPDTGPLTDAEPDTKDGTVTPACQGTIPVKIMADFTGATAGVSIPYYWGEYDYLRELNEAGGIAGCKLEIESRDYAYDPVNAETIYKEWKTKPEWPRVPVIFGFGSGDTSRLGPLVKADQKPLISASYAGDIATPEPINKNFPVPEVGPAPNFVETSSNIVKTSDGFPYNFFAGTDYSTAIRVAVYHAQLLGGKRIAFFQCSSSLYCTSPIAAGRTYAKQKGLEIGRDLDLPLSGAGSSDAEYTAKIGAYFQEELDHKTAEAGAGRSYTPVDWVWLGNTTKTAAQAARIIAMVAAEKNLVPAPKVIVNTWGFDETFFTQCGGTGGGGANCVDTVFGVLPFAVYGDSTAAEMAKVVALHDKWRKRDFEAKVDGGAVDGDGGKVPIAYRNVRYVQGYVSAMLFRLAAERVVAAGKPINGETIKGALETFARVDTGGLTDKLTFKPNDHRPQSTETIYKLDAQGKLIRVPPDRTIFVEDAWLGW